MATTYGGGDTPVTGQTEAYMLDALTITVKGGSVVDLARVFVEIEIFEDIFKSSITGSITINDSVGGLEKFIYTGGERITIKASMPPERNKDSVVIINRSNLIVHEFSKTSADAGNLKYKLYFTSESTLNSLKKRIFKSYKTERNISKIVKSLYSEIESANGTSATTTSVIKINASDTWISKPFICPGYTPIDAINHLAKRTSADGKYYVFYERLNNNRQDGKGWHHYFTSIDDIIIESNASDKTVATIKYSPAGSYFTTQAEDNIRAKTIQYQNNYNHLSSMIGGFYNSRVRSLDVLSRRYSDIKISYKDNRDSVGGTFYTNKFLDVNNYFAAYGDKDFPGERLIVSPMNDAFTDKKSWIKNDTYGAYLNSSIRITVDIAGGTNRVGIGDVIELRLPSVAHTAVNKENSIVPDDEVYQGKYIVTACRHNLSKLAYVKKVELSRGNMRLSLDQLIAKGAA
jgi:hypothetical protein